MLFASDAARDDFAGRNADVHVERLGRRRVEVRHRPHNRVGGARRACRLVAMRHRSAEDRHDRIADVLVDAAAEALDDRVDDAEEALEQLMDVFGIELLRQLRIAAKIGEQDGDGTALGFGAAVGFEG